MNYTKQNAAGEKHLLRILFSAVSGPDPLSGRAFCSDMKLCAKSVGIVDIFRSL